MLILGVRCAEIIKAALRGPCHKDSRPGAVVPSMMRLLACVLSLAFVCSPLSAATPGTVVSNTATLGYEIDGAIRTVSSNTVKLIIAEKLDVTVVADASGGAIADTGQHAIGFLVANAGSGTETFALTAAVAGSGAAVVAIAIDEDDNGLYDPQIDRQAANAELPLAAGRAKRLFVLVGGTRMPTVVSLSATATTGSGTPGTTFERVGDGGGDAVVGQTGATATATIDGDRLTRLLSGLLEPSLTKSQSVVAPDGSSRAVQGSIVTYRLDANFPRAAAAVQVEDLIPAGTAYVAGSLTLDGAPLSDVADADAGRFAHAAVAVALGDVEAGNRTISFQVRIL